MRPNIDHTYKKNIVCSSIGSGYYHLSKFKSNILFVFSMHIYKIFLLRNNKISIWIDFVKYKIVIVKQFRILCVIFCILI